MSRNVLVLGVLGFILSATNLSVGDTDPPAERTDVITFRAIETDAGLRVQIEMGGLVMQSEQLTILHEAESDTSIRAVGEKVEMRHAFSGGEGIIRAEVIQLSQSLFD